LYFQASLKKDGVEAVNSAAAAAYLNNLLHLTGKAGAFFAFMLF